MFYVIYYCSSNAYIKASNKRRIFKQYVSYNIQ